MGNKELAASVKEFRKINGLSQEQLAENSGLSLRTVQRIENGETDPRGDTLIRLAKALKVTTEELIDFCVYEDKSYLTNITLSSLSFIIFPFLGIIIPLILWVSKKDKIKNVDKMGKELLNFQISWTVLVILVFIFFRVSLFYRIHNAGDISPSIVNSDYLLKYAIYGILYSYNFIITLVNTISISNEKGVRYFPKFKFLK
jgi:uncharacterized Tic20 family protein